MSHVAQVLLQKQMRKAASNLKDPRRGVDEQGRNVQFPQWTGPRSVRIAMLILAFPTFVLGVCSLAGLLEMDEGVDVVAGALLILGAFTLVYTFYSSGRMRNVWYYEDENGFEMLTQVLNKKVSISYDDISSWRIDQRRMLYLKTYSGKKANISLVYLRPLQLLNAMVTMVIDGRLGKYSSEEQRNQVIWALDSEYCVHANKVLEEMEKTGVHVDIPER